MIIFRAISLFTTAVTVINLLGRFLNKDESTTVEKR